MVAEYHYMRHGMVPDYHGWVFAYDGSQLPLCRNIMVEGDHYRDYHYVHFSGGDYHYVGGHSYHYVFAS
jgi:hypothetical protein